VQNRDLNFLSARKYPLDPLWTRFGLIRHAPTDWNLEKRIQGQSDRPLAAAGKRQARRWGSRLEPFGWDRILASDIGRAFQTAELVNETLRVPIDPEPRLREQDWGLWTGMTLARLQQETAGRLKEQEAKGWKFHPPGGEVLERVWQRSRSALDEAALKWPGRQVLVISHQGVLRSLLYRFNNAHLLQSRPLRIRPGCLHLLLHDRQELRLEKINAFKLE